MAKKKENKIDDVFYSRVPSDVRELIGRKLCHLRAKEEIRWEQTTQTAFEKFELALKKDELVTRLGWVFYNLPMAAYEEMLVCAEEMTHEWPRTVWQAIATILDKAQFSPFDTRDLEEIVNEYAWSPEGWGAFTLRYLHPDWFKKKVEAMITSSMTLFYFDDALPPAAEKAMERLLAAARQAREEISIATAEFVMAAQRKNPSPTRSSPSSTEKKENGKNNTRKRNEKLRHDYLRLKKKHEEKSKRWIVKLMIKKDVAQGIEEATLYRLLTRMNV